MCLFFGLGFTSHQLNTGHIVAFQLYCLRKNPGAPPCIILGMDGHLRRTSDVLYANWIAYSHERAGLEPAVVRGQVV
jgi:hypothetical protein